MFLRERDRAPAALNRSPNRDDARDARFVCAAQDIIEVGGEIGVIEMGVSVYQHCRFAISDFRLGMHAQFNLQSAI
jgi:hypothetical protein